MFVAASVACSATAVRQCLFSSCASTRDWEVSPKMRPSAVTSLRNPCWNDSWTKIFKSPTLEDWGSEMLWLRPLAETTVTWNINRKQGNCLTPTIRGTKGVLSQIDLSQHGYCIYMIKSCWLAIFVGPVAKQSLAPPHHLRLFRSLTPQRGYHLRLLGDKLYFVFLFSSSFISFLGSDLLKDPHKTETISPMDFPRLVYFPLEQYN